MASLPAQPSHDPPAPGLRARLPRALALLAMAAILIGAHYRFLTHPQVYAGRDFMSIWGTGRAVLEGADPYDAGDWIALRVAQGSRWFPDDISPFPLWTGLILLPLSALPIDLAAAVWLTLMEVLLILCIYAVVVRLEGRAITRQMLPVLMIGAFLSRWTVINIHNGQITILLLGALTGYLLLERERPFAAGLLLSLAVLKPNSLLMALPVIGVWLVARRRWRVIAGGAAGLALMLAASWLVQPGWIGEWIAVGDKAALIPFRTPTVWGLSGLLMPEAPAALGLAVTLLATAGVGWVVLKRRELTAGEVAALAVAYGLFVAPYAWAYEQALLFLPIAMIAARARSQWARIGVWLGLCLVLPWALFGVASQSGNDGISGLMPLIVALGMMGMMRGTKKHPRT